MHTIVVLIVLCLCCYFFFFKQKTAYEMRISDWSSDVCSSDLDQRSGCFVIVSPLAQLEAKVPSLKAFPWCITLVASFISLFLRTPLDFPAPAVKRSGSTRAGFCSRSWRPGHLYPERKSVV